MRIGKADVGPLRKKRALRSRMRAVGEEGPQLISDRDGERSGVRENIKGTGLRAGVLIVLGEGG